ncbi:unnamed protein product [Pylaiella littoralis]
MGPVHCCGFCCGYCYADDDALMDNESAPTTPQPEYDKKNSRWCANDSSATERVFVPDASRNKYVVVGLGGATVRAEVRLNSAVLKRLPQGTIVVVSQVRSRRAQIIKPIIGWVSLSTESGYEILGSILRPTKYKVVYQGGILVRSSPIIEEGGKVKIAPYGTVLKATGKTEIFDAIERVEVEDGWVSMRLREDNGSGAPLLMALN